MHWKRTAIALGLCVACAAPAYGSDDLKRDVFGWVEKVALQPTGIEIKAKLDTGALTSSLHAEDIERFEKDGEDWVRFTTELEDEEADETVAHTYEKPLFRNVIIRGAGGEERRPVVLVKMCLGGTLYEEQVTLEDRDDMLYPLLIGRRTIQHLGLIDVTRTFLREPDCDEDSDVSRQDERETDQDIGT